MTAFNITLPDLNWFLNGNVFSGSLGTDPRKGCLGSTTFEYRVKAVNCPRVSIVATYRFKLSYNAVSNMEEMTIGRFEASDFGLGIARNWLLSRYVMPFTQPCALPVFPAQVLLTQSA